LPTRLERTLYARFGDDLALLALLLMLCAAILPYPSAKE
jgi:hypothetical protein